MRVRRNRASWPRIAPGLDLTVDYGWLTVIGAPLFWLLSFYHSWTGNWGVAIILLTMSVKLAFFPLSAAGYRSMAKLRLVTPKLQRLREQHGNDRQRMHQAMMDFYKTEKINPMGGCLPILVQIPVFISLILGVAGKRGVALRAVRGVDRRSIVARSLLCATGAHGYFHVYAIEAQSACCGSDPGQGDADHAFCLQRFFFFFPAGLVLYSLVNNVLSIAQQWQITRMIEGAAVAAGKKKTG